MQSSVSLLNHAIGGCYSLFQSLHRMQCSNTFCRRQQFLIRCLQRTTAGNIKDKASEANTVMENISEADAIEIVNAITPVLDPGRHKGQAGKVAVIGGCREYTGAPYFAALSALKIGADLCHVFCTHDAATVIKSYSPELIVHPVLEESYNIKADEKEPVHKKVLAEVCKWIDRFDCLVVGPGLGRDPFLLDCVAEIIRLGRKGEIPIVIDGDGLFLVTNDPELVKGYPLAVLTPNVNEHKRLVQKLMINDEDSPRQLQMLAKHVAVFSSWARHAAPSGKDEKKSRFSMNPVVLGAIAGSVVMRKAASLAFEQHKRSTLTTNIIEFLGKSMEDICPAQ